MCGFVAVFGPGEPLALPLLERMRDRLAHRGPDGSGAWVGRHAKGSIALGFRRLAIIDTRQMADQPMLSMDGRKVIVFNGEIYNFIELRGELEAAGRVFQTRSDTEVLLQGYEHWGEAVVERLNGMFAFVIWDEARAQIFVARDRFGEKPLYISRLPGGRLALASEIKALLVHPEIDASYDLTMFGRVLDGHLLFGTDETLFSHVRQFRASHCMTLAMNGEVLQERRYWAPVYDRSLVGVDPRELGARLRAHLERSLAMRMRSDVPVTACLSGGLDSSTLVMLLAGMDGQDERHLRSVMSVRFPEDPTIDEGSFIDRMLQSTGLEGHSITPLVNDLMRDMRQMHWHHETIIPGPSMFLEWSLMREARALGYKVILDGQGADELLAGYSFYLKAYQTEMAVKGPLGFIRALRFGEKRNARLRQAASLYAEAFRRFNRVDGLTLKQLIKVSLAGPDGQRLGYGNDVYGGGLPIPKEIGFLRFDLALNLLKTSLPSNLFSGDRNSMAHGIECRYPFLDYELADFTMRLPDSAYLEDAWGKALLRQCMSDTLPREIVWRPDKVGFAAPQDRWLATPAAKSWLAERVYDPALGGISGYSSSEIHKAWTLHQSGAADFSSTLWKWASAAELLDMKRTGVWHHNSAPVVMDVSTETARPPVGCKPWFDEGGYFIRAQGGGEHKTAWIISYTPVCKEPRVIRQAKALEQAGWRVVVFGLPGSFPHPPTWNFVGLVENSRRRVVGGVVSQNCFRALRFVGAILVRFGALSRLGVWGARLNQWATVPYLWKRQTILKFLDAFPDHRPQLVLCHDYFTVDVALEVGRRSEAPVSLDCHEYALGQYTHNDRWMRWHRPMIKALQDNLFARVDGITTVCGGIADLLTTEHSLKKRVCVVRSTPFFTEQPFRATGGVITVLYHGEIFPTRMLHIAVRSLHLWRLEFRLVLRGLADPAYLEELRRIAAETGVQDRLLIEPPVLFDQIVPAANRADIGYFVHQDTGPQRRFALPNKFFEYVMAGLAVVVSDMPEMASLVRKHDLGVLVPECDEKSIASIINSLDRATIDRLKKNSLRAATELNWESEKTKMLRLYEEILA
jgi:asparagine synthase (glutamine-hydrolysing)